MNSSLDPISTYFNSYEDREAAFRRAVGFSLARRHAGPAVFWRDFNQIARGETRSSKNGSVAYIPSNPRDCLAFGTPRQVLMASLMSAANSGNISEKHVLETARQFEISELLSQPIRTLSGGETVQLALAKTTVSMPLFSHVVVASPFTWLSNTNRHLLEHLNTVCKRSRKPLSIMALAGEGDLDTIGPSDPFIRPSPSQISFRLKMTDVQIPLMVSLHPLATRGAYAAIENITLDLISPCLMVGDNGQGKSLLARTIAHAVSAKGHVVLESPHAQQPPRLLFQDVLSQTMLRSFGALSHKPPKGHSDQIYSCYCELQRHYANARKQAPPHQSVPIGDWSDNQHSLVDIKTILVAARLAGKPSALILDEPDWGMSRSSAVAFVSAVIATAHRQQTAVMLISHKPWWYTIAGSLLRVTRSSVAGDQTSASPVFTIGLELETNPS